METRWRELFHEHAQTDDFRRALLAAKEHVHEALQKCPPEHAYVSFSGGKDSTALLHLVLSIAPQVAIFHWDYGPYYMPRDLEREIVRNMYRIAQIAGVPSPTVIVRSSQRYQKQKRSPANVFFPALFGRVLPELRRNGYRLAFIGLRAEEGVRRRQITRSGRAPGGIQEVYPLKSWTWLDVWGYIVSRNLPYPSHYDRYALVIGWDRVRFSTFFDPEFDKFGGSNLDGILMWRFRNADVDPSE